MVFPLLLNQWTGYVGVGFPAVVRNGVVCTAANSKCVLLSDNSSNFKWLILFLNLQTVDRSWIGTQVEELFYKHLGLKTKVVNDADAAGYAEIEFGAASGEETSGIVMMITFGTGIGTAMFVNGILVNILLIFFSPFSSQLFFKGGISRFLIWSWVMWNLMVLKQKKKQLEFWWSTGV